MQSRLLKQKLCGWQGSNLVFYYVCVEIVLSLHKEYSSGVVLMKGLNQVSGLSLLSKNTADSEQN